MGREWKSGFTLYGKPVVVIDPEANPFAEGTAAWIDWIEDQYRSQTQSPKPDEPQGLGAVVEGPGPVFARWIRVEPDGSTAKWLLSRAPENADPRYVWSAVPAVTVLSEGWS